MRVNYTMLGYSDAKAGRGFRPDYDLWTYNRQVAYEAGRLKFAARGGR